MTGIAIVARSHSIEVSKKFAAAAARFGTEEYNALQMVRRDYPGYKVVTATRKAAKPAFKGLTYAYMERYIESHGTKEDRHTYDEMKLISECHSKSHRYPVIKNWFLEQYPEIKQFGVEAPEEQAVALQDAAAEPTNITELPVSA